MSLLRGRRKLSDGEDLSMPVFRRSSLKIDKTLTLSYIDEGKGDPVLFVPGFTFSADVFAYQVEALSKTHRVIVVDPRSHGLSTMMVAGNNYPQHGRDLDAFITKLGLTDVTLVGWSFGALSTWSYVEAAGLERLKGFVCIDMPPVPLSTAEQDGAWVEGPVADLAAGYHAVMTPEGQRAFMAGYAEHVMVQRELSVAEMDWLMSLSLATPSHAVADLYASGLFSNYLGTAKRMDAELPGLYVIAEHWAETAGRYVAAELRNAHTAVLGGHMMFWEHAEAFNAALVRFLER